MMLDLLLRPSVSTILVKGNPGTGKSSLVLELLRMHGKGTYVSTRVSKENLLAQNPHVSLVVVGGVRGDLIFDDVELDLRDYRLAGADQVVHLVFNEIKEESQGLIVLDSWDSVAKELTPLERNQAEKTIVSAVQANDSRLVFVSEEPSMTTTDFLVDAIVELSLEMKNGYFRRWIETKKIRGQKISNPRKLFTLNEGKFSILESLDVRSPGQYEPSRYVPLLSGRDGVYSTGTKDLDQILNGGFRGGSTMCLDHGEGIAPSSLLPFDLLIYSNFIASGGCVVLVPSAGVSPDMVLAPLRSILPPKVVESSVRLGFFDEFADVCTFTLGSDAESSFSSIRKVIDELKGPSKRPCFIQLGVDKLEYVYGKQDVLKQLTLEVTRAKSAGDVFVSAVGDFTESKRYISAISDVHTIFETVGDTLTAQSLKPTTPVMGIAYEYSRGFPTVSLTPIT